MTNLEDTKLWKIDPLAQMEYEKILKKNVTEKTTKIIFETYDYPFLDESCSVEFEPGTSVKEMVQQFMRTIDIEFDKKLGPGGIRRVTGTCYDRIVFKDDNENYKYIYIGNFYHN